MNTTYNVEVYDNTIGPEETKKIFDYVQNLYWQRIPVSELLLEQDLKTVELVF